ISIMVTGENPSLKLNISYDYYLFENLIVTRHQENFPANDPRNKFKEPLFKDMRPSAAGKFLDSILDLFGGLYMAHNILQERYWREIFDYVTNRKKVSNAYKIESLERTIKEKFSDKTDIREFGKNNIEYLAKLVIKLSKDYPYQNKEIDFEFLSSEAEQEIEKYNNLNDQKFVFDERDLKRELDYLMQTNLLVLGLMPICPQCGLKNWIRIDDVKYSLKCQGCSYGFTLISELKWYYKLNSLFEVGYAKQGLTPLIIVLGELLSSCRSSFTYAPSLDLFETYDNSFYQDMNVKRKYELDLVCFKDGVFIIGEVKENINLFKQADFDKMHDVSLRINPDRVLFSSMDKKINRLTESRINELSSKLSSHGIAVEWFQIPEYYFEPSLVR